MKLAIMQPYFFPYIGYFQLINAVDKFIIYDDVNYIKRGWINRNNILINNEKKYFTLNLSKLSQNKLINEIKIGENKDKILQIIKQNYIKAPFFDEHFKIIEEIFNEIKPDSLISQVAGLSLIKISEYFNINTKFEYSSEKCFDTKGLEKADRLIAICKKNNADTYINAIGGRELYNKEYFLDKGINLKFIKANITEYRQNENVFEPSLSIIDVMMYNSKEQIHTMFENYELL